LRLDRLPPRREHCARVVVTTAICLLPFSLFGYQDEGHLFTSATVVYTAVDPAVRTAVDTAMDAGMDAGPAEKATEPLQRPDVARLVAFCTQLPDQTLEYDAIQVVNHAAHLGDAQARQWLQWVQQDLHALTGGDVATMRHCAQTIVNAAHNAVRDSHGDDPNDVCALGFAVHLFGDAYAHFGFDGKGKLYSSPFGHMTDYHEPDLPFYEPKTRVPNWLEYASRLRGAKPRVSRVGRRARCRRGCLL
jgi:hypothetical protein